MTYITDQNSTELRAHIRSLQKHPEWRDAVTDRLFKEIVAQDEEIERLRKGLQAAIRAARLALFVINKHVAMPNDSWASGFDADLKTADAALAALPVENGAQDGR
jgi:hypothetical protein